MLNKKQRHGAYYNKGQRILSRQGQLGEVWISGYQFAHNLDQLRKFKIGAVCCCVELGFQYPKMIEKGVFSLKDTHDQKADKFFKPAFQFIERNRQNTNVLVNCAAGISRSATILIAYMMQKYGYGYNQCYTMIKSVRPCVQPNMNFLNQLLKFQVELQKEKQKQRKQILNTDQFNY